MVELEGQGVDDVLLFVLRQRVEEKASLAEMVLELRAANALLHTCDLLGVPNSEPVKWNIRCGMAGLTPCILHLVLEPVEGRQSGWANS